jgi:hypothetical protein
LTASSATSHTRAFCALRIREIAAVDSLRLFPITLTLRADSAWLMFCQPSGEIGRLSVETVFSCNELSEDEGLPPYQREH